MERLNFDEATTQNLPRRKVTLNEFSSNLLSYDVEVLVIKDDCVENEKTESNRITNHSRL